jgi:hypothetical protein
MSEQREALMRRRDVLRVITAGVAVAAVARLEDAAAEPPSANEKRKSRYQPNSPEVQDFYRVNRYPPQ